MDQRAVGRGAEAALSAPSLVEGRGFLLACALLVGLPGLWSGFVLDDWWQLVALDTRSSVDAVVHLYDFSAIGAGFEGFWWRSPELSLRFFRPLSSALSVVDHAVFGSAPAGWHAHQLVWWLALVLAVRSLLDRTIGGRAAALGALAFALDDGHLTPMTWVAARHSLVSAFFAVSALTSHVRWRTGEGRGWGLVAALSWAAAFLGGESALAGLAYLAAWEAFAEGRARDRLLALGPAFAVAVAWAAVYRLGGFGVRGSGWYHDPGQQPVDWVIDAAPRGLALLSQLTLRSQVDGWLDVRWHQALALSGAVGVGLWSLLFRYLATTDRPSWERTRWLLLGALASLVPMVSTLPASRLLVLPSVGAAAAIGVVIDHVARRRTLSPRLAWPYRWTVTAGAGVVFLLCPAGLVAKSIALSSFVGRTTAMARAVDLGPPGAHVVIVTASNPGVIQAITGVSPDHRPCDVLSVAPYPLELTRTASERLEVRVVGGSIGGSSTERLFRASDRVSVVGDSVPWSGATIRVLDVDQGNPSRFEVVAGTDLDGPTWAWRVERLDGVVVFELPRVGQTITVAAPFGEGS